MTFYENINVVNERVCVFVCIRRVRIVYKCVCVLCVCVCVCVRMLVSVYVHVCHLLIGIRTYKHTILYIL